MENKPSFLITIDTEGDNVWQRPENVTTRNSKYLYRFQDLCEKYNFKPTYLTNYEMANSKEFQKFGRDVLNRGVAEIGMHLHAWDMPPKYNLTTNDLYHQPYLFEFPVEIMRRKIAIMTDTLQDNFGIKMLSHRAGRWGINECYAQILIEYGYKVDCSVTPYISWSISKGHPEKNGGPDFRAFFEDAYFIDPADISKPGQSDLLEIPVSIINTYKILNILFDSLKLRNNNALNKALNFFFSKNWLRPNNRNLEGMLKILDNAIVSNKQYVEFVLHSSEFMPGGSPRFPSDKSIKKLYINIEKLFAKASGVFSGKTLTEFYNEYSSDLK